MKVKVCVIQDHPVFFDKEKTLAKIEDLVREYASKGCQLVVFPESFVPGYPRGFSFGTVVGSRSDKGRELYRMYHENSINIKEDGEWLEALSREQDVYIVLGATEQSGSGSLYCSMIYLSPSDGIMGVHRKIKPTGQERVIWAEAGAESLITVETRIGRMGGLICWENYMPLARMAMYRKGIEIYVAPTADSRETWTPTLRQIALEGRCYVLGSNQYFTRSMYPEFLLEQLESDKEEICEGGSVIVGPDGGVIAGPLFGEKGALVADLDLDKVVENKLDFDVAGHYSRDDIFELIIKDQPDTIKEKSN